MNSFNTVDSPNIARHPLNPQGALEMGLNPCQYCQNGWGQYSHNPKTGDITSKSCSDSCDYLKQHVSKNLPDIKSIKIEVK